MKWSSIRLMLAQRASDAIVSALPLSAMIMAATTWLQIVKAVLFLVGGTAIAFLVMMKWGFDSAHGWRRRSAFRPKGSAILTSQFLARDSVSAISPGLALTFGTVGAPHILMRFFTVPDARAARVSVFWATSWMNYLFPLAFVIGFGALALLAKDPAYLDAKGRPDRRRQPGGDPPRQCRRRGSAMLGFISAVAFSTILAVVAGLTLAGVGGVARSLCQRVPQRPRRRPRRGRGAARRRVPDAERPYVASLTFAVACCSTFPLLLLSIHWRELTTRAR